MIGNRLMVVWDGGRGQRNRDCLLSHTKELLKADGNVLYLDFGVV